MSITFEPGWLAVNFRAALEKALNVFGQKGKATETLMQQRVEETWARQYMATDKINFAENSLIFAVRLTNYAANGSTVECEDEETGAVLLSMWSKLYKWMPLGIATGRVYLLPYIVGDTPANTMTGWI